MTYGFQNIWVSDVDEAAIAYQTKLLVGTEVVIRTRDLNHICADEEKFDVVIDASVSDVFIANGGINAARKALNAMLKPTESVLIVLSMHHHKWLTHLKPFHQVCYSAIQQWTGNARNPRNIRRDIAMFVCFRRSESTSEHKLSSDSKEGSSSADLSLTPALLPTHELMVEQLPSGSGSQSNGKWKLNPRKRSDLKFEAPWDLL